MKDPNKPESASETRLGKFETTLVLFFILCFAMPMFWGFQLIYIAWTNDEVVSTRPIGNFVRMSGPGGFQGRVVIETDVGSYPMRFAAAAAKGTPLVLELRASGKRYICSAANKQIAPPTAAIANNAATPTIAITPISTPTLAKQCVETDGPDFGDAAQGAKP